MKIVADFGKDVSFTVGYSKKETLKYFSLILVEVLWSTKYKTCLVSIGIPYIFGFGILFSYRLAINLKKLLLWVIS